MTWLGGELERPSGWATVLSWLIGHHLDRLDGADGPSAPRGRRFEEWHLRSTLVDSLVAKGQSEGVAERAADTVSLMIATERPRDTRRPDGSTLAAEVAALFDSPAGKRCLMVNRHAGVLWFHREAFTELLGWLALPLVVEAMVRGIDDIPARIVEIVAAADWLAAQAEAAGWRVDEFSAALGAAEPDPKGDRR
jgi:hypothetical protein